MPMADASWLSHHCPGAESNRTSETILVPPPKTVISARAVWASRAQEAGRARDCTTGSCFPQGEKHRLLLVLSTCQTTCLYPFENRRCIRADALGRSCCQSICTSAAIRLRPSAYGRLVRSPGNASGISRDRCPCARKSRQTGKDRVHMLFVCSN